MYRLNLKLFPIADVAAGRNKSDDDEEDEHRNDKVSEEVARQREQIRFLQKTVEDQTRLLQEISHQLKQTAGPVDTGGSSAQEIYV